MSAGPTTHLLEWGATAPGEWLWRPTVRPTGGATLSFHLPSRTGLAVFVKCGLFWRAWSRTGGAPGRAPAHSVRHTRRWTTLEYRTAGPVRGRWAEAGVVHGLVVTTATTELIRLVRLKRFDYSRWGLTLRGVVHSPTRWAAYTNANLVLLGQNE